MKNGENNKWLDKVLGQALGEEKSRPDFEKWQENHRQDVEMLTSRAGGNGVVSGGPLSKGATVMKSRIVQLAAAAVIIAVVAVGIKVFSGPDEQASEVTRETLVKAERERATDRARANEADLNMGAETTPAEEVDVELKKIEQMYLDGDVQGLVALLASGEPATRMAASNFLAQRQGAGGEPLPDVDNGTAEKAVERPSGSGIEKGPKDSGTGEQTGETGEVLVATGRIGTEVDSLVRGRPEPDTPAAPDIISKEDELTAVEEAAAGKHVVARDFEGYMVYPADVDGDGDLDVVGSAADEGHSQGRPFRVRPRRMRRTESSLALSVEADSESTGLSEPEEEDRGALYWWENTDRKGTTWVKHVVDVNFGRAEVVYPSDVDGDRDVDIVGSDVEAGALVWWENMSGRGTTWSKQTIDTDCDDALLVFSADIDGDRDTDVVGATHLGGGIYWWENSSGRATDWVKHVVDSNTEKDYCRTHCLRLGDMDRDGDVDIVASAGRESGINWWENPRRKGEEWARHYVAGSDGEVESVFPSDLDRDGDLDLVGSIRRHDGLTWWENTNGAGTEWVKHVIDSSYTAEQVVDAADMDNDGDLDIVGSSRRINSISWWENRNGKATEWVKHVMNKDFGEAFSAYAADMDDDGRLDVLAVGRSVSEIAWFEKKR
ncbi:MAG TPA: VCBS repeat-containing protein [Sedimentisphaerales bacterium]|nr:VCBS repeat-containing protein [Sedimentisphaerales bacterium]